MLSLIEARTRVQAQGIATFYNLFHVGTPHDLMLQVLFNLHFHEAWKHATAEQKETLLYQRAIFELACEEAKNLSTRQGQQNPQTHPDQSST